MFGEEICTSDIIIAMNTFHAPLDNILLDAEMCHQTEFIVSVSTIRDPAEKMLSQ